MPTFYADLHLHSKHSRATSRDADLEHLSLWARKKGIAVVGTGDFTHPGWLAELKDKLVEAEPGLFRLRPEIERAVAAQLGRALGQPTRFMLQVEISTIYKRGERTRKVHHLVYLPRFEAADQLVEKLSRIGNLASDGRPILGLDSRDLLEIVLECGEGAYLVPAHIWTPWFAVLGSKSGFDSVEDCYGELAAEIFAVETGLSSDPPMNWRVSALDRYTLVSNSDAHSPPKLGREACVFDTELDFFAMRRALQTRAGYRGTVEFFPEEGKYHLDGHRKCGVRLTPALTREHGGRCPACGGTVTVGVMHRVEALADRPEGGRPRRVEPFRSLLPLGELLSEIEGVGAGSRRVARAFEGLIGRVGPELQILEHAPIEELSRAGSTLLAEAVRRMRAGQVRREGGFDGEYGVIRLFEPEELARSSAGGLLFSAGDLAGPARSTPARAEPAPMGAAPAPPRAEPAPALPPAAEGRPAERQGPQSDGQRGLFEEVPGGPLGGLDPDQRRAAEVVDRPLLILAGPGTGKTRTLTHRIAHLIGARDVDPERCLAITFTRRAADELRERLQQLLGREAAARVVVQTFHALGHRIVREQARRLGFSQAPTVADEATQRLVLARALGLDVVDAERELARICRARRGGTSAEIPGLAAYRRALHRDNRVDLDDLIDLPAELLADDAELAAHYRRRFCFVSIDEYQDIDARQYALVRAIVGGPKEGGEQGACSNLCAIGDPDQAIYGFRGADVAFFERFQRDFPGAEVVRLTRGYRCDRAILSASLQVIGRSSLRRERRLEPQQDAGCLVTTHEAPTEAAEAEFVVQGIERLIGGHTFFSLDSGRSEGTAAGEYGFSDIAVLYRLEAQAEALELALGRSGIPFQRRSHRPLIAGPLLRWLDAQLQRAGDARPLRPRLQAVLAATEGLEAEQRPQLAALGPWLVELAERCTEREALIAEASLAAEVDSWDPRADRVSLLTLHAAKGLEFAVVFIVGCNEGLLPLCWGGTDPADAELEEERRLFFVGMTRAKQRLLLLRSKRRRRHGRLVEQAPSRFVGHIEQVLLEISQAPARPAGGPDRRQLGLWD